MDFTKSIASFILMSKLKFVDNSDSIIKLKATHVHELLFTLMKSGIRCCRRASQVEQGIYFYTCTLL